MCGEQGKCSEIFPQLVTPRDPPEVEMHQDIDYDYKTGLLKISTGHYHNKTIAK